MPPKKGKGQITTTKVFVWGIGLMVIALLMFGGPLQWAYEQFAPDWARQPGPDVPEGTVAVDLSVRLANDVSGAVFAAVPVYVYDSTMTLIEYQNTDSTTGVATFQADYFPGETIYFLPYSQPGSSTGILYSVNPIPYVVGDGDVNGDVQAPQINLAAPSSSAATFTVIDQASTLVVSGGATGYINETDTSLTVSISCTTSNTHYGMPEDFNDPRQLPAGAFNYKAGVWLVMATNETQELQQIGAYYAEFSVGSTYYYIFHIDSFENDALDGADGIYRFDIKAVTAFNDGSGDCSVSFDIYDCAKLNAAGQIDINSFKDYDSDVTISAVTTYIK
jgi:hypothetical protein